MNDKPEIKLDGKEGRAVIWGPTFKEGLYQFFITRHSDDKPFSISQGNPDHYPLELIESDELIKPALPVPNDIRKIIVEMYKFKNKLAPFKYENVNGRHIHFFIIHEMGAYKLLAIAYKENEMVFSRAKIKF